MQSVQRGQDRGEKTEIQVKFVSGADWKQLIWLASALKRVRCKVVAMYR